MTKKAKRRKDSPIRVRADEFPACMTCGHWIGDWTCNAFPRGIPEKIRIGLDKHETPFPGDNGIRYKRLHTSDDWQ